MILRNRVISGRRVGVLPGKPGTKNQANKAQGSKFIAKPGTKAVTVGKKPIKTGGSRGS